MKYILFIRFLALALVITSATTYGQRNVILSLKNIGGNVTDDIGRDIVETSDGGYIFRVTTNSTTGNINTSCGTSSNHFEVLFQKYDPTGDIMQWEKCFLADTATPHYLFPLINGGVILGGTIGLPGVGSSRWMIRKVNLDGSIAWTKHYGGADGGVYLRHMARTYDGGYIMAGESNVGDGDVGSHYGGGFSMDIWAIKLDSNGDKVWSKVIGGTYDEGLSKVIPLPDGDCYIAGYTISNDFDCTGLNNAPVQHSDVYIARLDSAGIIKWHKCLGGSNSEATFDACLNSSNGLLIAGNANSADGFVHNHKGKSDYWFINLDTVGNVKWDNCYGNALSNELPRSISLSNDKATVWITGGSVLKGGNVDTNYGRKDVWTICIDTAGNFKSGRILGSAYEDEGMVVRALSNDMALIGGYYSGRGDNTVMPSAFYGVRDVFLAKIASWTTGAPEHLSLNQSVLDIFPNPAKNEIVVDAATQASYQLVITNASGNKVYSDIMKEKKTVSVASWPRGIYYVQATDGKGHREVQKLLLD